MLDNSFVFVPSRIDVKAELPFEVIPGHFFRNASSEEIAEIKRLIDLIQPLESPGIHMNLLEQVQCRVKMKGVLLLSQRTTPRVRMGLLDYLF